MREKIKLESSAGTGHFYTTMKNKKLMPEKMEIKKFDPVARKHVTCTNEVKSMPLSDVAPRRQRKAPPNGGLIVEPRARVTRSA